MKNSSAVVKMNNHQTPPAMRHPMQLPPQASSAHHHHQHHHQQQHQPLPPLPQPPPPPLHQPLISNSLAIRQEIQRFESVHPSIYAIYDLIDLLPLPDAQIAQQIRDHVVCIEGKF